MEQATPVTDAVGDVGVPDSTPALPAVEDIDNQLEGCTDHVTLLVSSPPVADKAYRYGKPLVASGSAHDVVRSDEQPVSVMFKGV